MLNIPAPYPHVGSYALLIDTNLPVEQRRAELVRLTGRSVAVSSVNGTITGREELVTVTFPLRTGATGVRTLGLAELIDGTPLNRAEEQELLALETELVGRELLTERLRHADKRLEELRSRRLYAATLDAEFARLVAFQRRQHPGRNGSHLPKEAA